MSADTEAPRCLDDQRVHGEQNTCQGPVEFHWNGDPGGKSWPRCAKHQERRMKAREASMEMYANSDVIPGWFDPSYAGERWEED